MRYLRILLWLATQAIRATYRFFAIVLSTAFSRRAVRNAKITAYVVVVLLLVFVALLAPQSLGGLVFVIIMLYALYRGARIAIFNR